MIEISIFYDKFADQVEFQMSFDRKTGKPIACAVVKLINNTVSFEVLSEDQVTGTVAQEATAVNKAGKTVRKTRMGPSGLCLNI